MTVVKTQLLDIEILWKLRSRVGWGLCGEIVNDIIAYMEKLMANLTDLMKNSSQDFIRKWISVSNIDDEIRRK